MIPVKDTLVDIDTLPGEEIEFGIGDPRWVMKTQADLYSDITTAIIREYSTNAYDAHVMAGNPDPIEVTLPSMMNPFFVVEDKGVGMDVNIFRKIYTQFGVSDKRDSNTTNGMLGYGSKSGIAYTTQFSVTSVKNGIKTHGIIQRKPDWRIVLKVVSQTKTDEPNGTRISIPVHNWQEFTQKANDFYKFWLPGRVRVNGAEPVHHVGEKITEGLYYSKDWSTSYVVMGNVAYRIANPAALFRDSKMGSINFVAYVDDFKTEDGSAPVEFTPSREDLKYTDRTKATLQAVIDNFAKEIVDTAKAEIDAATSHAEAYEAWSKWTGVLGKRMFDDLEYKGDKFQPDFPVRATRYDARGYSYAVQQIRNWHVEQMSSTMVITDFGINLTSTHKKKVKEYAKLKDLKTTYFLFVAGDGSDIKSPWFERGERFVSWEDVKAALPKAPVVRNTASGPGRVKGTFDFITPTMDEFEKELPKDQSNLFYITVQETKRFSARRIANMLFDGAWTVVILPQNRLAKFNRENPKVQSLIAYAQTKVVKNGGSLLCDDAKKVKDIEYTSRQWLSRMDLSKIDDPEIHRLRTLIKNEENLTKRYDENLALAGQVGMRYNVREHEPKHSTDLSKKYPLLSRLSYYSKIHSHVYVYMNAVHAAEKENKNV